MPLMASVSGPRRVYNSCPAAACQGLSPLFKMIARAVFGIFTLLALFQAGVANFHTNKSSSACNCQPVIKVSVDGNTDSCNKQLLQEVNDLKKQLTAITEQLREIIQPVCKFDFEGGIHDWDKTGTAFNNQPTYGDNPTARSKGEPANQQGDWWIGGYEHRPSPLAVAGKIQGDKPQGTLTSPYFTITGKYLFYLIGGGCDINTVRAELVVDNKVVHRDTGKCTETMTRKAWDVEAFVGQRARVKLVDFSSAGWGHINFDDLRGDMSCGPN